MSATITTFAKTRHVLQGVTPLLISTTEMAKAATTAYEAMIAAAWKKVPTLDATMPVHNWAQTGLADTYEAFKFCGDYAAGKQLIYAGAACYTLKMPADALTGDPCYIESVAATLFGDRWLADGASLAAIPSASAEPPTWAQVLAATNKTAALMAVTPSNTGADSTATASITFAANTVPLAYLHLVLRLDDYTTHRGAWVEGSATLLASSIAATFSRAVVADTDPVEIVTALRQVSTRQKIIFTGTNYNLEDSWLRKHWGNRMLRDGRIAVSSTPAAVEQIGAVLSPSVSLSGYTITAVGYILPLYCPASLAVGKRVWLSIGTAITGASKVRISLFSAAPSSAAAATWAGSGATCIGTVLLDPATTGTISIPITRAASGDIWAVASIEEVLEVDGSGTTGWADSEGINFADAHVADVQYESGITPDWIAFDADNVGGIIQPLLYNLADGIYPIREASAILTSGSAAGSQSSLGAYSPALSAEVMLLDGSYECVALVDVGYALHISGTLPDGVTGHATTNIFSAAANLHGLIEVDATSGTVSGFGTGFATFYPQVSGWATDATYHLRSSRLLFGAWSENNGTALIAGKTSMLTPSIVTDVAACTDVADIRFSDSHIIVLKTDGTCLAWANVYATAGAGVDVSTWTDIIGIAAAKDCVFGWKADGTYVMSGLTSWVNASALSGLKVRCITGSSYQRAAFKVSAT